MWKNIPRRWADMTEDERKNAAYAKGQHDYAACHGLGDSNPIVEAMWSSYDPPDGYEADYAAGWKHAKSQT
jgi:hypothetical protein